MPDLTLVRVASAGLTIVTTAYTAGDVLGSEITVANAVATTGGYAILNSVCITDYAKVIGAVDLYVFPAASTPAADNAAESWSDANKANCLGIVHLPSPTVSALNNTESVEGLGLHVQATATSLFVVAVTRTAHTFFGAVGDLTYTFGLIRN